MIKKYNSKIRGCNCYAYKIHKIPPKYKKHICEFYDAQNLTQNMIDKIIKMLEREENKLNVFSRV
jgi:hypothetical protein